MCNTGDSLFYEEYPLQLSELSEEKGGIKRFLMKSIVPVTNPSKIRNDSLGVKYLICIHLSEPSDVLDLRCG